MTTTARVLKRKHDGPRILGFAERVALFICALHKPRAEMLFQGLAVPLQTKAKDFAAAMGTWDSARRQARLTHEFQVQPDAAERAQQLVVRTQGVLRAAVVAALPPSLRSQYPQFQAQSDAFAPAVRALADRLVKEATR